MWLNSNTVLNDTTAAVVLAALVTVHARNTTLLERAANYHYAHMVPLRVYMCVCHIRACLHVFMDYTRTSEVGSSDTYHDSVPVL
jgi:hypothetical protein